MDGAGSDFEFLRARRAVELGWVREEDVEAAQVAEDAGSPIGLTARLDLNEGQRQALHAPPFPPEIAAALADPARLVGRFVRVARLGGGGMGDVWRAWDLRLAR